MGRSIMECDPFFEKDCMALSLKVRSISPQRATFPWASYVWRYRDGNKAFEFYNQKNPELHPDSLGSDRSCRLSYGTYQKHLLSLLKVMVTSRFLRETTRQRPGAIRTYMGRRNSYVLKLLIVFKHGLVAIPQLLALLKFY